MIARMSKHDRLDTAAQEAAGTPYGMPLRPEGPNCLPPDLILEPMSRKPTVLPETTVRTILDLPAGAARAAGARTPGPFEAAPRDSFPRVSIVVITRDHLVFTKLCLESVLANTDYPAYELIVVDNGSGGELLSYLDELKDRFSFIRVVRNETNRGFAAANNQGLAQATGDRFVLLNNDTIVPQGWLTRLIGHLDDPLVGAVGPVTNRISNEAQIETSYRTYAEFERFARDYTCGRAGGCFEISMLAMFCFAVRRETHERVGKLDEQYQIAMFEDDDYAVRLRSEGYRLICAEDVFVHHFGGVSLGSLPASGGFQDLLTANRERFERKWGIKWQPQRRRTCHAYQRLVAAIREVVGKVVPAGARVLVISKGDPDLIDVEGRRAEHFPRNPDGSYTGYHPADSAEAITHLQCLHVRADDYLIIPSTFYWWLEHYIGFARYLAETGEEVFRDNDCCVIFKFGRHPESPRVTT
jgi:GT2 family glycosyltransferase